jgi:hypothetical protein
MQKGMRVLVESGEFVSKVLVYLRFEDAEGHAVALFNCRIFALHKPISGIKR